MRHFPNWVQAAIEYTSDMGNPKKYMKWSAYAVMAAALERKIWLRGPDGGIAYPNIYVMLVGPSAVGKTSTADRYVEILEEAKITSHISSHLTQASLIRQMHEAGIKRQVELNGVSYPNSAGFLYAPEAVTTLKESFGSITQTLTDFYDCKPGGEWSKDRFWAKNTISAGEERLYNTCLNLLACSTPEWLMEVIGPNEIRGGFFSRIFFAVENTITREVKKFAEDEQDELKLVELDKAKELKRALHKSKLIDDLRVIAKLKGCMTLTPQARHVYNEFLSELHEEQKRMLGDKYESYYGRKHWHVMKLVQIISAAESDNLKISVEHVRKAVEEVSSLEKEMRSVFGNAGENKEHRKLVVVWDYMRKRKLVSRAQVLVTFHRDIPAREMNEILQTLVAVGKIKPEPTPQMMHYRALSEEPLA